MNLLTDTMDGVQPVSRLRVPVQSTFYVDQNGNPKGGTTWGEGFHIQWQNGVEDRNGAFLEEVIAGCIQRYEFFQNSKFNSPFNALAISHLKCALAAMADRLAERSERGVEGTYTP